MHTPVKLTISVRFPENQPLKIRKMTLDKGIWMRNRQDPQHSDKSCKEMWVFAVCLPKPCYSFCYWNR